MTNALIANRKSVFPQHFIQKAIPPSIITQVLRHAEFAPTHRITEPWRFVVFHSDSAKEHLATFMQSDYKANTTPDSFNTLKFEKKKEKVIRSGAVIAIVMKDVGKVPQWEEVAATAMAVQNIWLSLSEFELGGYWSSPKSALENANQVIDLGEDEHCMGFFYLGYYTEHERHRVRTPIEEKIAWK
ncbi:MAG: nitroreductase [Saprospiraceae bacterium]|nr:nitroreductase [Saprospiraceae bacterium]